MKYPQALIATSSLYDTAPGRSRDCLAGFYSDKHARVYTGPAKSTDSYEVEITGQPIGHNPLKSFLLAKSVVPIKRDKAKRVIKVR